MLTAVYRDGSTIDYPDDKILYQIFRGEKAVRPSRFIARRELTSREISYLEMYATKRNIEPHKAITMELPNES